MITGRVTADSEAMLRLTVRGPNGRDTEVDAVLDTGFTGFLTLPSPLISLLELTWRGRQQGLVADGRVQIFDVYEGTVLWDGQSRSIEVDGADTTPLVGMGLLWGHDVRIHAVEDGPVTIEALL